MRARGYDAPRALGVAHRSDYSSALTNANQRQAVAL
jgi:hypothetical protein